MTIFSSGPPNVYSLGGPVTSDAYRQLEGSGPLLDPDGKRTKLRDQLLLICGQAGLGTDLGHPPTRHLRVEAATVQKTKPLRDSILRCPQPRQTFHHGIFVAHDKGVEIATHTKPGPLVPQVLQSHCVLPDTPRRDTDKDIVSK